MAVNSTITPTTFTIPQQGDKITSDLRPDSNTQLLEAISKLQQYATNVDNCGNCANSNCCQSCQTCQATNCGNCPSNGCSYSH